MNPLSPGVQAVWQHNSPRYPRWITVRVLIVHPHTARIECKRNGRTSQRWVKHQSLLAR